ncbi:hypothetical protein GCM10009680_05250 [Streptomyces yatensis]|uniref:Uncharacterized protein n=1 Tax=Streptomyces yatensis TaxID=155177 RepID=A0ABP4S7S8_9ACTN
MPPDGLDFPARPAIEDTPEGRSGAGAQPPIREGAGWGTNPPAAAPLDTASAPPYLPRNHFRELSGYFRKAHDAHTSVKVKVKIKVHPPRVHPRRSPAAGRDGARRLRERRARGFG